MKRLTTALIGFTFMLTNTAAAPSSPSAVTTDRAAVVLRRIVDVRAPAIPAAIMQRALAIAVFPGAAWDEGCYSGPGVISNRESGIAPWSTTTATIYDAQLSVSLEDGPVDLILIAVTPAGVERLAHSGTKASVVALAGPLVAPAAETFGADIFAYVQFGDFLAGVPLATFAVQTGNPASAQEGDLRQWREAIGSYFKRVS